jgi:DnaK suppressor protein
MNKTKLKRFKSMYEQERKTIIALLKLKDDELDIDGDDIDQVQGRTLSAMVTKLSNRDMQRLGRIEIALKKIDEGTFGTCESCGELIGEKRLEALPGTDLCVRCAEVEERELRAYAAV